MYSFLEAREAETATIVRPQKGVRGDRKRFWNKISFLSLERRKTAVFVFREDRNRIVGNRDSED